MSITEKQTEICNQCARKVSLGSGLFVNRISDFNDISTRIDHGVKFPAGDFICRECDELSSEQTNVGLLRQDENFC